MTARDFWTEVMKLAGSVDKASYYQLLSLAPDAGQDAVRDAYSARATTLHPDRHVADIDGDPERKRALERRL